MLEQLKLDLKAKHHIMPKKSMMMIVPKFQELAIGLKQFHCFNLSSQVYNYLYGTKSQDATTVLQLQRMLESKFLNVVKHFNSRFKLSGRNNIFTVFSDYMEIMNIKPEVDNLTDESERAAGYLMMLIMMASSELVTNTDRIVIPIDSVIADLPPTFIIPNYDSIVKDLTFVNNYYTIVPYSRPYYSLASYITKVADVLMSDRWIQIIKTAITINGSRRGTVTKSNIKSFMWMNDIELSAMFRSLLNILISNLNEFHATLIDDEINYLHEDQSTIATFIEYLFFYFDRLVAINGVLDTAKIKELIDKLRPSKDNKHMLEKLESVNLMEKIVDIITKAKVNTDTEYTSIIVNMVLESIREEIRLNAQQGLIRGMKTLNLEDVKMVQGDTDFDPIPKEWFDKYTIPWGDIMVTMDRFKVNERRIITDKTSDIVKTTIHPVIMDTLPLYTVEKDHDPIPLQIDFLNGGTKLYYITPIPIEPAKQYARVVSQVVDNLKSNFLDIFRSRLTFYDDPIAEDVSTQDIEDDLAVLKGIKALTNPVLSAKFKYDPLDSIMIFDIMDSSIKVPMVIPKSKDYTTYAKYEIVKEDANYWIILVPFDEVSSVDGMSMVEYFASRVDSKDLPDINLTYDDKIVRSQVSWVPSFEFATAIRLESQWLNDIEQISRVVTERRAHMVRISIAEMIKRRHFRDFVNFAISNKESESAILRPLDVFKEIYNTIYDLGSDYLALDVSVKMYGRYDSHQGFAYRNSLRNLSHLIEAVAFFIVRCAYTEQVAIHFCPIPKIFSTSNENVTAIKKQVKDWFTDQPQPVKAEVTSMYDTIVSHVKNKLGQYAKLNASTSGLTAINEKRDLPSDITS